MTHDEAYQEIEKLFLDHPDGAMARAFHISFNLYCHKVDDLIDEGATSEQLLEAFHDSLLLYTMPFFIKHIVVLLPVINVIHHTYADSVIMEHSPTLWHREHADCLRQIGMEMLLTIVQLLGGYKMRRKLSIGIRERAYILQHNEDGQPT